MGCKCRDLRDCGQNFLYQILERSAFFSFFKRNANTVNLPATRLRMLLNCHFKGRRKLAFLSRLFLPLFFSLRMFTHTITFLLPSNQNMFERCKVWSPLCPPILLSYNLKILNWLWFFNWISCASSVFAKLYLSTFEVSSGVSPDRKQLLYLTM